MEHFISEDDDDRRAPPAQRGMELALAVFASTTVIGIIAWLMTLCPGG